jgi:hypothetical protein
LLSVNLTVGLTSQSGINPFRLPLLLVLAVDPVLTILALFLFDPSLEFFAFLTAVAHETLLVLESHAKPLLGIAGRAIPEVVSISSELLVYCVRSSL